MCGVNPTERIEACLESGFKSSVLNHNLNFIKERTMGNFLNPFSKHTLNFL